MTQVSRELAARLLADLLDLREPEALDVLRRAPGQGMRALWASDASESNARFRHAWKLVWGIAPSRLDFLEFRELQTPGDRTRFEERFADFLMKRTKLGIFLNLHDSPWMQRVRDAVESYAHPPYEDAGRRAWIEKLCERYGGDARDLSHDGPISELHQRLIRSSGARDGDPFKNPFTCSTQPPHRRSATVAGEACSRSDAAKYASARDGSMLLRVLQAPKFNCVLIDKDSELWASCCASSAKGLWMVERTLDCAFPTLPILGERQCCKYKIVDRALRDASSDALVTTLPNARGLKHWTRALRAKLVRDGVEGRTRHDLGLLAFWNFMVRCVDRAGGDDFCYDLAKLPTRRAVLIVDNRENPLVLAALAITLSNLAPREWGVCVCCSHAGLAFYRSHVGEMVSEPHAVVYCAFDELGAPGFDAVAYSELLKSRAFWDGVPFDKVLIVQDDSAIARKGLEASGLLEYDYVGAPWEINPALVPYVGSYFVGNGGLSIRSVGRMAKIAEADADRAGMLFANGIQVLPEDVFFGGGISRDPDARACPESAAEDFACEMRSLKPYLTGQRPMPFGFHKIWPYHPIREVEAFFKKYLD